MNSQVDEVKSKIDIVSVVGEYVDLKKAGRNYKANCPFHSEKTPSFMVSPELQIYKCFGCGESGDVFTFLEKYEAMTFQEALKHLAQKAGVELVTGDFKNEMKKERIYEANRLAAEFYHYLLLNHPNAESARNYLKTRKIEKLSIETFKLGFAPDSPDALSNFLIKKKRFRPDELIDSGLVYGSVRGLVDRFRGRIIFPITDTRGKVIALAGRILEPKDNLAKYINSPETPIYHKSSSLFGLAITKEEIKKTKKAILVEGEFDLISPWQKGIKNTVAIKGTSLTEGQLNLLSRLTQTIIFALDSDFAGNQAAIKGILDAQGLGLEVKVAELKGAKDPDEMVQKNLDGFLKAIKEAADAWDFIIEKVISKYDSTKVTDKAKIAKELVPLLSNIPDPILKSHYTSLLAQKLSVPIEAITSQIKSSEIVYEQIFQKQKTRGSRRELLEENLLALVIKTNEKLLLKEENKEFLTLPFSLKIAQEIGRFLKERKKFDPKLFLNNLPDELRDKFSTIYLKEGLDEGDLDKEIEKVKKELKTLTIKEKLTELKNQLKDSEIKNDKKIMKLLKEDFKKHADLLSAIEAED